MDFQAKWIRASEETGDVCPVYRKEFQTEGNKISRAELYITALGVYKACLNGKRIGGYVLAPGWTSYDSRLQYQVYDVTELLEAEDGQDEGNVLEVTVGKGWYASPMAPPGLPGRWNRPLSGPPSCRAAICGRISPHHSYSLPS